MNFYEIWGWLHFLALMKTQTIFVFTVREKINARGSHARVTREGTSEDHTKAFQPRSLKGTHGISNFPQRLTRNRAWGILKQRGTILPITLQVVRTSKVRLREYSTSEA